jgi:O-antigen ligase
MLQRLGLEGHRDRIVFLCLTVLVLITPTGEEASRAITMGAYRTLLLAIVVLYAVWTNRSSLQRICPYFLLAAAALVMATGVSVLLQPGSRLDGAFAFWEKVLFAGAFIALAHAGTARPASWKRSVLGAVVLINAGYIAAAMLLGGPQHSPFVNPNYLASFVLPGIAVCAAVASMSESWKTRLAAVAAGLFLYSGVVWIASRGATLAGLALLSFAGVQAARRHGVSWRRLVLAGALLGAITVSANPALVRKFLDRGERDPHNYMRAEIWLGTLSMIQEHPFAGVGLRQYYYEAKRFNPAVEGTVARYGRWPNIAHSEYLQTVAEIGIPAAALLFTLVGYLFVLAWRRGRTMEPEDGIFQHAALLAAAGLGIHALVDNNLTVPVLAAGLAVISQADLLPYRGVRQTRTWSPVWRAAAVLFFSVVWLESTVATTVGFYFNDEGNRAYKSEDLEQSERMHRFALAVLPDHPVLIDNLGMVYLDHFMKTRETRYLNRAESLFLQAISENPRHDVPAVHLERVLFQRLTGDVERDRDIHNRIIEIDLHILRQDPFNALVRKNLAEAFYNSGQRERAYQELQRALEYEPNYVPAYLRMADWHREDGRLEESEKFKKRGAEVVQHYQHNPATDPFEAILLGRSEPGTSEP